MMDGGDHAGGSPVPPPAAAVVIHRTRDRWRLRVPQRKRDLGYFIALYDALRTQPEVREVTVNPTTASVLLWFDPTNAGEIPAALTRTGLLTLAEAPANAGRASGPAETLHPEMHHALHMSVNDTRILVFVVMLALSLYQLSKKQFLAPALTMALYVIDLIAGLKVERDAAARAHHADVESAHHD